MNFFNIQESGTGDAEIVREHANAELIDFSTVR